MDLVTECALTGNLPSRHSLTLAFMEVSVCCLKGLALDASRYGDLGGPNDVCRPDSLQAASRCRRPAYTGSSDAASQHCRAPVHLMQRRRRRRARALLHSAARPSDLPGPAGVLEDRYYETAGRRGAERRGEEREEESHKAAVRRRGACSIRRRRRLGSCRRHSPTAN